MIIRSNCLTILTIIVLGIVLTTGCLQETLVSDDQDTKVKVPNDALPTDAPKDNVSEVNISTPAWMNIELTDVATGKTFKISDFVGKPILMESFAVWCPTCLKQQQQTNELKIREGETIVHISLDVDPNEDAAKVREHIETHGFDWYFAVSPIELSNALMDEFGLLIVSAPQAPVVLICEDGSFRLLKSGVKSSDILFTEVEKGC